MIYFIRAMHSGAIKIGTSNDPKRRLEAMQTGSPEPLQLITVIPGQWEEEKRIHRKFAKFRMHGEWFKGDPELIQGIRLLVQAPIEELLDELYAEFWIIRGSAANGSNGGQTDLFCVCRDGKLIPDPDEMVAAVSTHSYEYYQIDSIQNVTSDRECWPKNLEVLREPLTSRDYLSWVAYLDDFDRFLPVPGSKPSETDSAEHRTPEPAEKPDPRPRLIPMPCTLPEWARPSNS